MTLAAGPDYWTWALEFESPGLSPVVYQCAVCNLLKENGRTFRCRYKGRTGDTTSLDVDKLRKKIPLEEPVRKRPASRPRASSREPKIGKVWQGRKRAKVDLSTHPLLLRTS